MALGTSASGMRQRDAVRWALASLCFIVLVHLLFNALVPLLDKSEARYALIALNMAQLNDWITPRLDATTPFWAKPPLTFWLGAASLKSLGASAFAARFPTLLMVGATGALVWWIGVRVRDRLFALFAILVFASMGLGFFLGGQVMTDPPLALGITLAMVSFWRAMNADDRLAGYGVFVGFAIAILAKGPIGLVLPGAAMAAWLLWERRVMDAWRRLPLILGALMMIVIAVPWYVLAERATPGYLHYFIIGEHFQRFLQPGWAGDLYGAGREKPYGAMLAFTFAAAAPWSLVTLAMMFRRTARAQLAALYKTDRAWMRFLILWALVPLVFFSLTRNVLITYVLPFLPALALLTAEMIRAVDGEPITSRDLALSIVAPLMFLLFTIAAVVAPRAGWLPSQQQSVRLWHADSTRAKSPPLYFLQLPFSASYYSGNQARAIRWDEIAPQVVAGNIWLLAAERDLVLMPPEQRNRFVIVNRANGSVLLQWNETK